MSDCSFNCQLHAFYDGELDSQSSRAVQDHLQACTACQAELAGLKKMSLLFVEKPAAQMLPLELARLHRSLRSTAGGKKSSAEADFIRTAGMLSALAASILVISSVWLAEFPSRHAAALSPGVAVVPASDLSGVPDWERTALTLQVDPFPLNQLPAGRNGGRNGIGDQFQIPQTGLADSRSFRDNTFDAQTIDAQTIDAQSLGDGSVDAQVADWMVAGLSAGGGHANP